MDIFLWDIRLQTFIFPTVFRNISDGVRGYFRRCSGTFQTALGDISDGVRAHFGWCSGIFWTVFGHEFHEFEKQM